jgi:hypothetical protein
MIHEITDQLLNIDLSGFDIITFDDGLYSQFCYKDYFINKYPNIPKIYYISTNIICPENIGQEKNINCVDAHKQSFVLDDNSGYMKLSQIKELYTVKNCFIGAHGHNHLKSNIKSFNSLKELYGTMVGDCVDMMKTFREWDIAPHSYCNPYNIYDGMSQILIKHNTKLDIIPQNRIAIEELVNGKSY